MTGHCDEHSGNCKAIGNLEVFMDKQAGKGGTNEQLFNAVNSISACTNQIKGGIRTACFILGLIAALLSGYLVKESIFTHRGADVNKTAIASGIPNNN